MKSLFTTVALLWLLTACQSSNQSKTQPGSGSDTTAVAAQPRVQYQVVVFERGKRNYHDDYNLMMRDFEGQVNRAIAQGWEPVGGVAPVSMFGVPIQAMIRKAD